MPALVAGIRSLEAYVRRDHVDRSIKDGYSIQDLREHFTFRGINVAYISDVSAVWDEGRFPDTELKLADAIFAWLRNAVKVDNTAEINLFLETFARTASFAFL